MDIELFVGFAFAFIFGILFLVLARTTEKFIDKSFLYTASAVIFFIMTPLYVVMEQTYGFLGFIFLIPAVFASLFAGQSYFQLYKNTQTEDWERDTEEP
jgi:hypothetical protein